MLLKLSEVLQRKYYHLVHYPFLIIENLIMDSYIAQISDIISDYEELRVTEVSFGVVTEQDNDLIVTYALKSIMVPNVIPLLTGRTG